MVGVEFSTGRTETVRFVPLIGSPQSVATFGRNCFPQEPAVFGTLWFSTGNARLRANGLTVITKL